MSDQIDVNQLSNALQQKVDLPSGKSQADIDYVVEWQAPTSSNNYTWYRLYKSGWVEQGGTINNVPSGTYTVSLIKNFSDTSYYVNFIALGGPRSASSDNNYIVSKTTQNFLLSKADGLTTGVMWEAKGMVAQS